MLAWRRWHVDEKDCKIPVNNYFDLTPDISSLCGGGVSGVVGLNPPKCFFKASLREAAQKKAD